MEVPVRCLKSPPVSAVPGASLLSRRDLIGGEGLVCCRQNFKVFRRLNAARIGAVGGVRVKISGTTSSKSSFISAVQGTVEKDDDLVFVAGATGRVGSRTVRELLKLGFRVRAGVRSAQKAEALVESVKQIKDVSSTVQPVERLEIVEVDLEKPETIGPALGKAAVVICSIGASEKEVFDVTGPYRIDYLATKNLIEAAALADVKHFIMVSSLGTNKIGFPAAILNLFWGVLFWKRKAEEALIASGIPYTIVRPGGMERPTDAYKETHNITLSEVDTLFGGQVSNLQVAELMAFMAKNRKLSFCKVVEVIAETTAPLRPFDELLEKIPYQRIPPKELEVAVSSPELEIKTETREKTPVEISTTVTIPGTQSEPVVNKPVEASAAALRPLSPFTAYEDLKPPTSPSPYPPPSKPIVVEVATDSTPSNADTSVKEPEVVAQGNIGTDLTVTSSSDADSDPAPELPGPSDIDGAPIDSISSFSQTTTSRPLSPYAAYEDLKPPTSPIPIVSGSRDVPTSAATLAAALPDIPVINTSAAQETSPLSNDSTAAGYATDKQDPPRISNHYHSPYYAYEDFKPPTSPTPVKPTAFTQTSSSPNGGLPSPAVTIPPTEEEWQLK